MKHCRYLEESSELVLEKVDPEISTQHNYYYCLLVLFNVILHKLMKIHKRKTPALVY